MRSIKKDLSVGLIIISIGVSLCAGAINAFYFISRDAKINDVQFSRDVSDLSQIIAVHLWTFNEEALKYICDARLNDHHIAGIKVTNDLNKIVFSKSLAPSKKNQKSQDIIFNNHKVGSLELTFDESLLQQTIWDTLLTTSTIIFFLCASAITLIQLLLKHSFTNPVQNLLNDINRLAKGTYKPTKFSAKREETRQIVDAFNNLAHNLESRDQEIQERTLSLKKAKEEWEETFNAITDIITIQDQQMRIVSANQAAYDFFNVSSEELVGRYCYEVFRGNSEPCSGCPGIKTLQDTQHYSAIIEHKKLNKIFSVSSSPIVDQNNEILFLVHIAKDVTEHKQMEAELFQAHKMEAIGTLAGGIAHDFNNILAAIIGYADMARDDISQQNPTRDYIDQVLKASNRAKELVKQILTFSHKSQESHQPLQPSLIVKEALKLLRASIPTTIKIEDEIDSQCGLIQANPTNIHQILVNLCTNALHAMEDKDEHGVLKVRLARVELSETEVASEATINAGPFIELMVSDTGKGLDEKTLNRIFEPYFTTKEVGKGSGMGLALVHGIVTRSAGFIRVESTPESGTTFHLYFPALKESITALDADVTESLPKGNEHIMVIDDEQTIVELNKTTLENLGYRVTAHLSSEEALDNFTSHPDSFDLIITDQTMPNLSGSELVQKILQIKPSIPIILCTGYSNKISEKEAESLGIKKFLMKPLQRSELAINVRKIIDEKT